MVRRGAQCVDGQSCQQVVHGGVANNNAIHDGFEVCTDLGGKFRGEAVDALHRGALQRAGAICILFREQDAAEGVFTPDGLWIECAGGIKDLTGLKIHQVGADFVGAEIHCQAEHVLIGGKGGDKLVTVHHQRGFLVVAFKQRHETGQQRVRQVGVQITVHFESLTHGFSGR